MELIDHWTPETWLQLRSQLVAFFRSRLPIEAESLTHDTLAILWEHTRKGTHIADARGYAFGIAHNLLAHALRPRFDEVLPVLSDADDAEIRSQCLARCLKGLSSSERKLLNLYYATDAHGHAGNRKRLAEKLGVSPAALRVRVSRLAGRLRPCVERCIGEKDV